MDAPFDATDDIVVLPTHTSAPGLGVVTTNAFLMMGRDPILVDTGPAAERQLFLATLFSCIDPARLSWIFLTHEDRDHSGNLGEVMRLAPSATLVTNFLALPKLALDVELPPERLRLVVPGGLFTANGRSWRVVRPPVFDAPSTVAFFDREEANLFSADCFGALTSEPAEFADESARGQLREGMAAFAQATAPWLSLVDAERFEEEVEVVRRLAPVTILSSHAPVLRDLTTWACDLLCSLTGVDPLPQVDDLQFRQLLDGARREAA